MQSLNLEAFLFQKIMARIPVSRKYIERIAIVGDGFTEKIYFDQMKEVEKIRDVVIKPELPKKSAKGGSYRKPLETAKSLVDEGYDHVHCIIDFDTVISENVLAEFTEDVSKINAEDITIYINNPCFETWILLHYEKTGKLFSNCEEVEKQVTSHLKDYCKNQDYLRKKNIYACLRPFLEKTAIPNAEFLEKDRATYSNKYPRAEVFKLLQKFVIKK